MTAPTIDQRLEALEREVRLLRAAAGMGKGEKEKPWWERLGGTFKDDHLFDEMVEAGQRYREALRQEANDPDPLTPIISHSNSTPPFAFR